MPEKVEALTQLVATAAGMRPEEVERHESFLQAFSYARAVEAWRADYLHSYFFYEQTLFALVASHLLGIPRGVSCYADHMLQDYPLKLARLHLQTCDVIVATSRRIRARTRGAARRAAASRHRQAERDRHVRLPGQKRVVPGGRHTAAVAVGEPARSQEGDRVPDRRDALLTDRGVPVEADIVGAPDGHSARKPRLRCRSSPTCRGTRPDRRGSLCRAADQSRGPRVPRRVRTSLSRRSSISRTATRTGFPRPCSRRWRPAASSWRPTRAPSVK